MKREVIILSMVLILMISFPAVSQVSINSDGADPDASAMLDVKSTAGGLLIPRMTMAQRDAINGGSLATGLMVYQTDNTPGFYLYDGSDWQKTLVEDENGWTISGNDMSNNNSGNIGIGMTPTDKLSVSGDIYLGNTLWGTERKISLGSSIPLIEIVRKANSSQMILGSGLDDASYGGFRFQLEEVDKMVMDNTGNLGIGIAIPTEKLDVVGNIAVSGTVDGYDISDYGPYFINSAGNNGEVWTSDGTDAGAWGSANNHSHATLTRGTGLSGNNYNGGTATTWSVVYGASGGSAVQGNQTATIQAGIGMQGGITADALGDGFSTTLSHQDLSSQASVDNSNGVVIQDVILGSLGHVAGLGSVNLDSRYSVGSGSTNYLVKWVGTRALGGSQIYDNGTAVGIGTTSPSQKLHVQGNMRLTNALYDRNNSPGVYGQVLSTVGSGVDWIDAPTDNDWTIAGSNVYNSLGGNVGIGTTGPSAKLDVNGSTRLRSVLLDVTGSPGSPGQVLSTTGGGVDWIDADDADWNIAGSNMYSAVSGNVGIGTTTFTQRLNVGGGAYFTGNIGIGTTNPLQKLHIYNGPGSGGGSYSSSVDAIIEDNASAFLEFNGVSSAGITFNDDGASLRAGMMYVYGSDHLSFITGGASDRMVITETGNVGIGTNNPLAKLDVQGNLKLSGWFDQDLSSNGYAKMGGVIIQWGTYSSTSDGSENFNFPKAFDNDCFSVVTQRMAGGAQDILAVIGWVETYFVIDRANGIDGSQQFTWIAIGR